LDLTMFDLYIYGIYIGKLDCIEKRGIFGDNY